MNRKPQLQAQARPVSWGARRCARGPAEALTRHDHGGRGRGVRAEAEAATFGQSIAQQGDVLLQSAGVFGCVQLAAQVQSLLL